MFPRNIALQKEMIFSSVKKKVTVKSLSGVFEAFSGPRKKSHLLLLQQVVSVTFFWDTLYIHGITSHHMHHTKFLSVMDHTIPYHVIPYFDHLSRYIT